MAGFDPKAYRASRAQDYSGVPAVAAPAPVAPTPSLASDVMKPWYDAGVLKTPQQQEGDSFWSKVGQDALTLGLAPSALLATAGDFILHPIKTTTNVVKGVAEGVVDMFDVEQWKNHPLLNAVNTVANISVVGGVVKGAALSGVRSATIDAAKVAALEAGADSALVDTAFNIAKKPLKASIFEAVAQKSADPVISALKIQLKSTGLATDVIERIATETGTNIVGNFLKNNAGRLSTIESIAHPVTAFGDVAKRVTEPIANLVFGTPEKSAVGKLYGSDMVKGDVSGFGQLEQWAAMQAEERGWKNTVENRVRVMQEWNESNPAFAALTPEERIAHFKNYAEADLTRQQFSAAQGREYVLTKALPKHYVEAMVEFVDSLPKNLTNGEVIQKLTEAYGKDFELHSTEVTGRLGAATETADRAALNDALKTLTNNRIPVSLQTLTPAEEKLINDLEGSGYRIGRSPTSKKVSQAADIVGQAKAPVPSENLIARRTTIGKLVDRLGLSPAGQVEGVQAFAFRESFTQSVLKEFGNGKNIVINGVKYPVEALASNLERLRRIYSANRSPILTSLHSIADLRYADLIKLGFEKADVKILDGIIRESNVASPAITGIGEALSNYIRTRNNPLSRGYNNFLRLQSDLRFKKNPMFGAQAAVEATVWGNMWAKTFPGAKLMLRGLNHIKELKAPLVESIRESTLGEQQMVLSEVMDEFTRQLRDAGMSPEIQRGLSDMPVVGAKPGIGGVADTLKFRYQNLDSNVWLGMAGFSNVKLATNLMRTYAERFGMSLEEALNYTMKDGKKVYDNPWMVDNMRSATQGIFGYKTGILTSPLIRTLNTVFFPIRFQTKTLIQTADFLGSLSPMTRLAVVNQWTSMAKWLSTPDGNKWQKKNRGTFAGLFNYVFAFEGMGKTVDAATRGQLFGGNAGLIGGLPFGFLANIARDLGYTKEEAQINHNTGLPYPRTVVRDTASFAGFVTVVEDIIMSMSPAMPFNTATGGAVTVSLTSDLKKFVEQVMSATAGALPGLDRKELNRDLNQERVKVRPDFQKKVPNPLDVFSATKASAAELTPEDRKKIVTTTKDKIGTIHTLGSGTQVRVLSKETKSEMESAYKAFPELPKGLLEAVYAQESSYGTNRANETGDQGKYGWMVGFTKGTYNSLKKQAMTGDERVVKLMKNLDFSSKKAALRSAAAYMDFRAKVWKDEKTYTRITDAVQLYHDRYNTVSTNWNPLQFNDIVSYYG